jgi:hypothetical protein
MKRKATRRMRFSARGAVPNKYELPPRLNQNGIERLSKDFSWLSESLASLSLPLVLELCG